MAYFGIAALEKFETSRHGAKEIAHVEGCALWRSCRADFGDVSIAGADLRPLFSIAVTTEHCDFCHRGDAGEGFAAKAERADMLEVVDLRYFAGGVARQGELQLIAGDAAAVVGDADELESSVRQVDANLRCSGVDTIF